MGQKVHPYSMRLGIIKNWKNRWFNLKSFQFWLREDYEIRKFLEAKLKNSGLESMEIERFGNIINVVIKTSRPGLIIGRGGGGIEDLKREIIKVINKTRKEILSLPYLNNNNKELISKKFELKLQVEEIRNPESYASIMVNNIAEQLERRIPFRKAMKQSLEKILIQKGVEGAKVRLSGRLGGSEIARDESLHKKKIPLSTLRADIDYAQGTAFCTYGTIGVKVWIYKGEVFKTSL